MTQDYKKKKSTESTSQKSSESKSKLLKILALLFFLGVIAIGSYLLISNNKGVSTADNALHRELYAKHFIPADIQVSRKSTEPTRLLKALVAYNEGNYKLSATVMLEYEKTLEPATRLAFALSLLNTNQESGAIAELKLLEEIPPYNGASFWYQGLIALRKSDINEMKKQFNKIDEGTWYKPRTLEILSQI